MKLSRNLAIILCCFLAVAVISAVLTTASQLPEVDNIIFTDDFADGTLNAKIEKIGGSGTLSEENGALILTRTSAALAGDNYMDGYNFYINEDKSANKNYFTAIDFSVSASDVKAFSFNVLDDSGNKITALSFSAAGTVKAQHMGEEGYGIETEVSSEFSPDTDIRVTYAFDHVDKVFTLYIDEVIVLENVGYLTESDNILYFATTISRNNQLSVSLKNLRVFDYKITNEKAVDAEKKLLLFSDLSDESEDEVEGNLNLFTSGKLGCDIEWVTDGTVISQNGTVTKSVDGEKTVNITAIITKGSERVEKTFTVTVKQLILTDMPEVAEYMHEYREEKEFSPTAPNIYGISASNGSILGLEFTVESENDYAVKVMSDDKCALEIVKEGTTLKTKNNSGEYDVIRHGAPLECEYTILIDPMVGKYSLWLANDKVVTLAQTTERVSMLNSISFEQSEGVGLVSNCSVFYPICPEEEAITFDYEYMTFEKMSYQTQDAVTADIRLVKEGRAGSKIEWTSTNESAVTNEGVVNSSESGETVLSAQFTYGSLSRTRTYDINVLKIQRGERIDVKNMIFEDNFDNNTINTTWTYQKNGGDILVEDEAMVIKRDHNDGDTMATLSVGSKYKGVYALEFTLSRNSLVPLNIRQKGSNHYFNANWTKNSTFELVTGAGSPTVGGRYGYSVKVTILYNTDESNYSLFLDDVLVGTHFKSRVEGQLISYVQFYLSGGSKGEVRIDNIKFYEANLLSDDRVKHDFDALRDIDLVDESDTAYEYGMISENLTLPTLGKYSSKILWTSSDESIISNTGEILYSGNEVKEVTLNAHISCLESSMDKEFKFKIIKSVSGTAAAVENDASLIDYSILSSDEGGSAEICRSLNLPSVGVYGSEITWQSSNTKYITHGGRVTRPRNTEENVSVTMTATIKNGSNTATRSFDFTVLKDEMWEDTGFMSDEEFFGVYEGGEWTTEGKLDYSMEELSAICEAAKSGNYALAKEELQKYFANREPLSVFAKKSRNALWANALVDDFYHLQSSSYFVGEMVVGNEWKEYEAPISTSNISLGGESSFGVRSWYNESSYVEIKRYNDANEAFRPRIELVVNGVAKTYYATDDAYIRAGAYKDKNYNDSETLRVQTFGDFLGDSTYHTLLKFSFPDLKTGDKISSARLILTAKASPAFSGEKRLIIVRESGTTWNSDSVMWNSVLGQIYSYNGLPDKNDWTVVPTGADAEYTPQMCRFNGTEAIVSEYLITEDDTYMYKLLARINDYLKDTGNYKMTSTTSSHKENGIRGGFYRSLDCGMKNGQFMALLEVIAQSDLATPDLFCAMLKNIWDTTEFLTIYNTASANWRRMEFCSILETTVKVPEFTNSFAGKNWRKLAQDELESALFLNTLSDGSYGEGTGGYSFSEFSAYTVIKNDMVAVGVDVSKEYDKRLHDLAYYVALMYTPSGAELQYGDCSAGTRTPNRFQDVYQYYNDKELEYIITYGKSGTEPAWTSKIWNDSTTTVMRANWTTNSPYLFTNVRGGGPHAHADANGVIVYAYGRTLLNDAGIFTYTSTDPLRAWGTSTKAHNTVLINNTSQSKHNKMASSGTIHEWATNSSFDVLSQSTPQNTDFEHRRTITFIKPDMWIVSDLMLPEKIHALNNYKQIWHMPPDANMAISEKDKTVYSNYPSGANIILSSADGSTATVNMADGYYDKSYGQVQQAPYAYFEKTVSGNTTFDTVIMPLNDDPGASLVSKKLETGENATALKIDYTLHGSKNVGYYYMSYDKSAGEFGKYSTDGQVAYVNEDANGNVTYFMIKDGTYIKNVKTDKKLLASSENCGEIALDMQGANLYLTTPDESILKNISVNVKEDKVISRVYLNGIAVSFNFENGNLSEIGGNKINDSDTVVPDGGIEAPVITPPSSSGGAGGGGGGGAAGSTGQYTGFPDVKGHWSEEYVNYLKTKNVLNGDSNGNFNPQQNITRAEFLAMIVRVMNFEECEYKLSFSDVSPGDWFAKIVQSGLENGLISADETFRPNESITRQEMAKIISVAAQKSQKYNDTQIEKSSFADLGDIASWAVEYVDYAHSTKLILGSDDGRFNPLSNTTRAEAATVIYRFLVK